MVFKQRPLGVPHRRRESAGRESRRGAARGRWGRPHRAGRRRSSTTARCSRCGWCWANDRHLLRPSPGDERRQAAEHHVDRQRLRLAPREVEPHREDHDREEAQRGERGQGRLDLRRRGQDQAERAEQLRDADEADQRERHLRRPGHASLHERVDGLRRLHEAGHAEGAGQQHLNHPEKDIHGRLLAAVRLARRSAVL